MSRDVRPYPLDWPVGQDRTPEHKRRRAPFGPMKNGRYRDGTTAGYKTKGSWTFGKTRDDLLAELERMNATHVVLSTDMPLRQDGLPYANRRADDPGVAVYFRRQLNGTSVPFAMACDEYDRLPDNCRALVLTIEALRKIERHGSSGLMKQAFSGFAALPPADAVKHWAHILGIGRLFNGAPASTVLAEVKNKYRELALKFHSDHGGSQEQIAAINDARDRARAELEPMGDDTWSI